MKFIAPVSPDSETAYIVSCGDKKTVEVVRDKEEVEDVRENELFECTF